MLSRRELIAAGVAGGLTTTSEAAGPAILEGQQPDREGLREIQRAIERIDSTLQTALLTNTVVYGQVSKVRSFMELFFRANTKFPDFIEVGTSVFMELYDWHVKNRQQLMVTKGADGRYWLVFMFTTMILRPEVDVNYVGPPYDKA
jgi:hypothetical protein